MISKITASFYKLPKWVRNRYFLTLLAFLVYMLFFDRHDIISQLQLRGELGKLEENKEYYKKQIDQTTQDLEELLTNKQNLEKFAREKYLMKKPDEDVFVIVNSETNQNQEKKITE